MRLLVLCVCVVCTGGMNVNLILKDTCMLLKLGLLNFDRSDTFLFVPRKYMPKKFHCMLGSFVAINLKKPQTRKCPTSRG